MKQKIIFPFVFFFAVVASMGGVADENQITDADRITYIHSTLNHLESNPELAASMIKQTKAFLSYVSKDSSLDQTLVCDTFRGALDLQIPVGSDLEETNRWLKAKNTFMDVLVASKPVCNDTNCWFAVAREYGRRYSRNYNWGLIDIFESYFIPSERYGTLDYDTRDALISNIVETAGFTPKDMERIGLTNFLNQVSQ